MISNKSEHGYLLSMTTYVPEQPVPDDDLQYLGKIASNVMGEMRARGLRPSELTSEHLPVRGSALYVEFHVDVEGQRSYQLWSTRRRADTIQARARSCRRRRQPLKSGVVRSSWSSQLLVGALIAVAACACGDDTTSVVSGGTCEQPLHACGGSVDGTWHVESVCYDPSFRASLEPDQAACKGAVRRFDTQASATMKFSGGTLSQSFTLSIDAEAVWTAECLRAMVGSSTVDLRSSCAAIQSNYESNGVFQHAACSASATDCSCHLQSVPMMDMSAGSYVVQGNDIVDVSTGDQIPYCVQASALNMAFASSDGTVTGQIVLSR